MLWENKAMSNPICNSTTTTTTNNNDGKRAKERPKVKIHLDSLRASLKKYRIVKHQAMMAYMDTG